MSLEAANDQWWKNAIVCCVDTQAFLDSNGDGIGGLDGLTQRIDYLAGPGVTCLWLMPNYPWQERDGRAPAVNGRRLRAELEPDGYHWFGRREGV